MKLEDALLCLVVESNAFPPAGSEADFCRRAIAGGVDLIQWNVNPVNGPDSGGVLGSIRDVCREDDALLVLDGDPAVALEADADGVHVSGGDMPIGYARSVLGQGRLVGLSSHSGDEAAMALDLEPDYLLHHGGAGSAAVFAGLQAAQTVLYAAGVDTFEQAEILVNAGVYRLAAAWRDEGGKNVETEMAALSKLLGRCV